MIPVLREALESYNFGVHGYEKLSRIAFQEAKANSEYSLPLFVLGELAQSFAIKYDCQPLTVVEAERQREKFSRYLTELDKAMSSSADQRLQVLSNILEEELNH